MVKLLENAKHKINMLLDKKWQKALSCECVSTCVHVACVEAYRLHQHTRAAFPSTRDTITLCTEWN